MARRVRTIALIGPMALQALQARPVTFTITTGDKVDISQSALDSAAATLAPIVKGAGHVG
jgi:hypothetical protein